ncbi:MAG: hypothetical protein ACE5DN_07925, partial [Flavobacteriales bacterium]
MKKTFFLSVFAIALFSFNKGPYPGFTAGEHGLYYKIISADKDARKPANGDLVTMQFRYANENG